MEEAKYVALESESAAVEDCRRTHIGPRRLTLDSLDSQHSPDYCDNSIRTTRYTVLTFLPKSFFTQFRRFANMYFLFQTVVMVIGFYTNLFSTPFTPWTMLMVLVFVMGLTMIFEARDDIMRSRKDNEINSRPATILKRFNGELEIGSKKWRQIAVGDLIVVQNKEPVPADVVLLATSEVDLCYVETSNVDGETNLKMRYASEKISKELQSPLSESFEGLVGRKTVNLDATFRCDHPNRLIDTFSGNIQVHSQGDLKGIYPVDAKNFILRGSILKNTRWIIGVVVYTGSDTKVMQNSRRTPSKMSNIEAVINKTLAAVVLSQCVLVTIATVARKIWADQNLQDPSKLWYLFPPGTDTEKFALPVGVANWLTFFILFNNFVPINLYVTYDMCNLLQGFFINTDLHMYDAESDTPARARSSNLCQQLGQVEYVFSDKTGTLTQNIMKFKLCSIGKKCYGSLDSENFEASKLLQDLAAEDEHAKLIDCFMRLLAVSHTVVPDYDGNKMEYQAESPDEAAMVMGASHCGYTFAAREGNCVTVDLKGEKLLNFEVLVVNVFNSTRKRMSVVVRTPENRILLLCKGADNIMLDRSEHGADSLEYDHLKEELNSMANMGLRTLVMGQKELDEEEFFEWKKEFDAAAAAINNRRERMEEVAETIETKMTILGATGVEDKLQDNVADTIFDLGRAGIKLWVLTGDKLETAINIGYSCKLLSQDMTILKLAEIDADNVLAELQHIADKLDGQQFVRESTEITEKTEVRASAMIVTGPALLAILDNDPARDLFLSVCRQCSVVIACRVSPLQKTQLVRMVQTGIQPQPITLAIGDGANDVGMIQEASIGIGISGKEGMQAVNSSDFAIAQFKFLKRLLLVHGRWNYRRICKVIVYSFYKNFCITLTLFYYTFFVGFSGTSLYEELLYNGFNIFTMLPIISVGVLDQDVKASTAMKYPLLYMSGRCNMDLNVRVIAESILLALVHSAIVFAWPYFMSNGMDEGADGVGGIYVFGTIIFSCLFFAMQYRVMLLTTTWTRETVYVHMFTFGLYFFFLFTYSLCWTISPYYYWVPYKMMNEGLFWVVLAGVPATALSFDYVVSYARREIWPNPMDIAAHIDHYERSSKRVAMLQGIANGFKSLVPDKIYKLPPTTLMHRPTYAGENPTKTNIFDEASPVAAGLIRKDRSSHNMFDVDHHGGFAFSHPNDTHRATLRGLYEPDAEHSLKDPDSLKPGMIAQQQVDGAPDTHGLTLHSRKTHPNRPRNTPLLQQSGLAWNMYLSPGRVWKTLCFNSLMFLIFGLAIFDTTESVVQVGVQYAGAERPRSDRSIGAVWTYQPCNLNSTWCTLNFSIPKGMNMKAPIYVYYGLTNFYQNFLEYTTDYNIKQLQGYKQDLGELEKTCKHFVSNKENGLINFPCGLQAQSMFNDTYKLVEVSNVSLKNVTINTTNIAWETDKQHRYHNPSDYPAQCARPGRLDNTSTYNCLPAIYPQGVDKERFMIWMRISALSSFVKLWGRIDSDIPGGTNISMRVHNVFPVDTFDGTKDLLFSTTSWAGGKNRFLGLAYMAVGVAVGFVWLTILLKQKVRPRKSNSAVLDDGKMKSRRTRRTKTKRGSAQQNKVQLPGTAIQSL